MRAETINVIREFTLSCRETLEKEVSDQLESIYGFLPDGKFESIDKYPALKKDSPLKTRRKLEQLITEEVNAGFTPKEARIKLVKEVAFTWLNRFIAFKMMEARNLITQTISKGTGSRGFLLWVTEDGNERFYNLYNRGDIPKNELGEGPKDEAYRRFILSKCKELSEEIKVLFDSEDIASLLFPRPRVLGTLIELMNSPELEEAWMAGNEETIGWVYQFFNEPDLVIFRSQRAPKVPSSLIAAKTQLFTPRWIVKFLVHNTIGRLWLQMHPDSTLTNRLDYLVPYRNSGVSKVSVKPVKEISILDPACGTMHFGLVAFDLLYEMYKEELQNAGKDGWPKEPSVSSEREIPSAIISNNLFGIDIDSRAIQLSALALYIKAKTLHKDVKITQINLVSTDVLMLNGDKLETFLNESFLNKPVCSRIIEAVWHEINVGGILGTLLRLEQIIKYIKEEEITEFLKEYPLFPDKTRFKDVYESDVNFWELLDETIIQAFNEFARRQKDNFILRLFSGEVIKSFKLFDILMKKYDVVITNPPYLDSRDYNSELKSLIEKHYPDTKRNLYSAFLERCVEFLSDGGRIGIVTPQTFMFISSFDKLRQLLRRHVAIETLVHTGLGTFYGAVVDAAFYVLRKEENKEIRDNFIGTYFRLVKEPDGESKRRRFELALRRLRAGEHDSIVFHYRQADFDAIPGSPWVYWIIGGLVQIFKEYKKLDEIAQPKMGMGTRNNFRFLRFWWEIGLKHVNRNCSCISESIKSGSKWFPYMKGGSFKKWYGNQNYCVNYFKGGVELKEEQIQKYPYLSGNTRWIVPNENFYFRRGVTWTDLTSGRFSARLSPGGFIFDVKGSSAFPDDIPLVLGLLNSSFAQYALTLINPTVSFQVGDIARLPIPEASSPVLTELVEKAIELAKMDSIEDETTYDFIAPPHWKTGIDDVTKRREELEEIERKIDDEVYRLYNISEEDRKAIEAELSETPALCGEDENPADNTTSSKESEAIEDSIITPKELAFMWVSYAIGIVMGRFVPGMDGALGRGNFSKEVAEKLRAFAVPDGIAVMDDGHPEDLPRKVFDALCIMLGEEEAQKVIRKLTGNDNHSESALRQYLERTFFKEHIKQYRKRPVYWLLQSPKKKYGVWVFHEKMTKDTLFKIKTEYVIPKINLLEAKYKELKDKRDREENRLKLHIKREIDSVIDILDDVREFLKRIEYILEKRGYTPHIDDGVLLNMAPLWELIPSWQKEPKKAWEALERGDYDWSYQAMDHWPDRVRKKCKTNRSFAIAHGLEEVE